MITFKRTVKNGVLYLEGSDDWREWLHHVMPGARRREIREAAAILAWLELSRTMIHTVAGHSMGACVATIIAAMHGGLKLYVYGGKRAPRSHYREPDAAYRHYRDIVPFLPPWRPGYRNIMVGCKCLSPWEAHQPRNYYRDMEKDGIR